MDTIGRFVHPVPFVREIYEATRNALTLQALKQLVALANRTAEVEIVMNDKHRCFVLTQVSGQRMWAEFPVFAGHLPWQSTVLEFVEPKLVGRSPHALKVVNAAMADQASELLGDFIDGKPILHVAAEAGTGRGDSLGVNILKRLHDLETCD